MRKADDLTTLFAMIGCVLVVLAMAARALPNVTIAGAATEDIAETFTGAAMSFAVLTVVALRRSRRGR